MRSLRNAAALLALSTGVLSTACSEGAVPAGPRPDDGGFLTRDASLPAPIATDLPCDIAELFDARCGACHGTMPSGGATISLVTHDDLAAASAIDPSATRAERSVIRMRAATSPMPPSGARASDAEIAALETWIAAGMPAGDCAIHDPFDTPVTCTSGSRWTRGNDESPDMHPGIACIACHTRMREGPRFSIAGTVYPSAHEPDDCNGSAGAGAVIEITDAEGRVLELRANRAGNFFSEEDLRLPYTARVLWQGRERAMLTPQTSGDCNGCHTLEGAMGAPGRVVLP